MLNRKQQIKILDLLLVVLTFVLFIECLFYDQRVVNWLCDLVTKSGVFGWVVVGIMQFVQVAIIPIPAYFITLTSMKMYPNDLVLLFIVTLSAVMLGVITAYWIGRKWGKKAVVWAAGSEDEYNKWTTVLKSKKTNLFYFLTVLLPIFPDDVLCLIAGSIRMNFWWFFFANLVGRVIGLISFMFVFTAIGDSLVTIIIFAVLLLAALILRFILKRRLKNESSDNR